MAYERVAAIEEGLRLRDPVKQAIDKHACITHKIVWSVI